MTLSTDVIRPMHAMHTVHQTTQQLLTTACMCCTEKAPNVWHRRGTPKTGSTYNQAERPSTTHVCSCNCSRNRTTGKATCEKHLHTCYSSRHKSECRSSKAADACTRQHSPGASVIALICWRALLHAAATASGMPCSASSSHLAATKAIV